MYLLGNIRKWWERFGRQFPQFVRKHKLTVLWTKLPDFSRVFVYFWHHVDQLGKLPLKEQQLSRTQHSQHATMFVLQAHYAPWRIPLTPMIRRHNYLLSTVTRVHKVLTVSNSISFRCKVCSLLDRYFHGFPINLSCQSSYLQWKLVGLFFLRFSW